MNYLMLEINEDQVRQLSRMGMNLSHLFVLDLLAVHRESYPDSAQVIPNLKEVKLLQDRFMIDKNGITPLGVSTYKQIRDIKEGDVPATGKKKVKELEDNGWDEVWCTYPASANFQYRGMSFKSSRSLRSNKEVCEQLYNGIIAQGEVTKDQIIAAIKRQVELVKKESFETGQNKMQYLPALEPYLRQQRYMSFIQEEEQETETTDTFGFA